MSKVKKVVDVNDIKIYHVKKVLKNKMQNVDDLLNRLETIKLKYKKGNFSTTISEDALVDVEKMIRSSFLSSPEFTIGYKYDPTRNILFVAWAKNGKGIVHDSFYKVKETYSKKFGIKTVSDRMRKAIKKDYSSCGDVNSGFLVSNPIVPQCVNRHIDSNFEKVKYSLRIPTSIINIVIG